MDQRAVEMPTDLLEQTLWLRALARQLVKDANTADDVVQATLIAAMEWGDRPREGLRNWLAAVARNVARQIGRRESRLAYRERKSALLEALPSAGEMVELVETQRVLSKAVLELAEHYRSTIILRYFEELTPTQIANKLDIPASTVRVRLKRGLELLRVRLESEFKEEGRDWVHAILPLALPPRGAMIAPAQEGLGIANLSATLMLKLGLAITVGLVGSWMLWEKFSPGGGKDTNVLVLETGALESARGSDVHHVDPDGQRVSVRGASAMALQGSHLESDGDWISGQLTDPAGHPIEGAEVLAISAGPSAPQILEISSTVHPGLRGTTDSGGFYRLEVSKDEPFLIRASHPGFAVGETSLAFAGERSDLVLEAGVELTVRVLADSDGRPLPGVQVDLESVEELGIPNAWSVAAVTDELGEVSLDHLSPGEFRVFVSHDGYACSEVLGVASPDEEYHEQELRLAAAVTLAGIVMDAATDRPLAGAEISSSGRITRSDHLGRFTLGGFAAMSSTLESVVVIAEGFAPGAEYIRMDTMGNDPHLVVRLRPPVRVLGQVVDAQGVPVSGIRVGFRGRFSSSPMKAERHEGRTISDDLGGFEFSLHPRGGYTIGAQDKGSPMAFTWVSMAGEVGKEIDIGELVLAEEVPVRGFVRDRAFSREEPDLIEVRRIIIEGDYPAHRQVLRVVGVTPWGTFSVKGLTPGDYELILKGRDVGSGDSRIILARHPLRLHVGDVVEDLEIRPAEPIRGVVRLHDGLSPEAALVSLKGPLDSIALVSTKVDSRGEFMLVPLGEGPFLITARDPGLAYNSTSLEGVMPGAVGLELQLQPRATVHEVSGRVLDPYGEPVTGVRIQFTNTRTRAIVSRIAEPDAEGRFSLKNLDQGPYDLRVMDFEGRFEPASRVGVHPGAGDVVFELQPHRD